MRILILVPLLLAGAACQRAKPSDVGAMGVKTAGGDALAKSVERGHEASPQVISPATRGAPYKLSP